MDDGLLRDRVAVITGTSRGLGAGMLAHMARRGLRVAGCARGEPSTWPVPPPRSALGMACDVTDGRAVERLCTRVAERLGPIDFFVANAGTLPALGYVADTDQDDFARTMQVNVVGAFTGARAYARHRRAVGGGGVLVAISSGAALRGSAGWAAYSASKAAVDRLMETVAAEESAHGLRAHAVAPGVIDTAMQETIRATPAARFPAVGRFQRLKAGGNFNSPGFVADQLLSLAFDPARAGDPVVLRLPDEHPAG